MQRVNATLEDDLARVTAELESAYNTGTSGQLASLRARRDALYQQQAGLAQDLQMALATLKAAEGREGERALEREKAALIAKYVDAGKRAEAALEGMAAAHGELLALNGEHQSLSARLATHARRFGSAPDDFLSSDVLRVRTGFLGIFEKAAKALERIREHREFLGDAPTEAVAMQRFHSAQYRQHREAIGRIADRNAARNDPGAITLRQRARDAAQYRR